MTVDDIQVPKESLVGKLNNGWAVAEGLLDSVATIAAGSYEIQRNILAKRAPAVLNGRYRGPH